MTRSISRFKLGLFMGATARGLAQNPGAFTPTGSMHGQSPNHRPQIQRRRDLRMEKEKIMKIRYTIAVCTALALAAGLAWTQDLRTVHFGGVINDYGPSTISGGPYEMRGEWSVDVSRTRHFTIAVARTIPSFGSASSS